MQHTWARLSSINASMARMSPLPICSIGS